MATKQININSLEAGTIIKVRGKVAFSRIRTQIAGEELRKQNDRDRQAGRPITEAAHTKLDMKNCQVLCNDPNNLTLAEKFIQERLYLSNKHPENGYCYRAMNKGKYLPQLCYKVPGSNPPIMQQFEPEEIKGELANDLLVTAYMKVFKGTPNNGLSLDYVCVEEPIRFYQPDGANALAAAGIILRPSSAGRELATPGNGTTASASQADTQPSTGYGEPLPVATGSNPYSAAGGTPYSTAGTAATAQAQAGFLPYGQTMAQQPQSAVQQATQQANAGGPVAASAVAAASDFEQNMNAPQQPQGIRYEATDVQGTASTRNYG